MRLTGAIALLFCLAPQDSKSPLDDVEALLPRLVSIDPEEREAALGELKKTTLTKDELKKSSKESPVAALALALLGDAYPKSAVIKLLGDKDRTVQAAAAEALAAIASDTGLKELTKLLDSESLEVAFAAARALARSKSPNGPKTLAAILEKYQNSSDRTPAAKCRAIVAAYGHELNKRADAMGIIRTHLESEEQIVREFSIVALANLPHGPDEIRKDVDQTGSDRGADSKKIFLTKPMRPEVRSVFGGLLVRAGVYNYADVLGFQTHAEPGLAGWARRRALEVWRRCVLIEDAVQKYAAAPKDQVELYEKILRANTGLKLDEEKLEDRVKHAKEWWEKNRAGMIDADVVRTIDLGVAWLRTMQQKDGSWKYCQCGFTPYEKVDHSNGTTALTLYTMVKMGVAHNDKAVLAGVEYLLATPIDKIANAHTYTISLQAMLFAELIEHAKKAKKTGGTQSEEKTETARYMKRVKECAEWLIEAQIRFRKGGYEHGPWTYNKPAVSQTSSDNSNTQFALLGLRAAANVGVPVPAATWQRALNHWLGTQLEDGGWTYVKGDDPKVKYGGTNSMSPAGMYCTLIAKASLGKKPPPTYVPEDPIQKAIGWMKKQYPLPKPARTTQFGHVFSVYYDLYSLERAMMIAEMDRIDGKDWYHDGALFILYNQLHTGEWLDVTDTCFALLFLKRAFVPVATGGDDK